MKNDDEEVSRRVTIWLGDEVDWVREKKRKDEDKSISSIIREAIKKAKQFEGELVSKERDY